MEKVDISKDFTVEDIHKIREAHCERTKNWSSDKIYAEAQESALRVQAEIQSLRDKREKYQP
ncbi:MAG: hypothetical protein MJZ05_01435 [Fibrobacter sp.]|nr:hypothetical protein [Fibrobacter sp.]